MPRRVKAVIEKWPDVIKRGKKSGRQNTYRSEAEIKRLVAKYESLAWGRRTEWLEEQDLHYSHIQYWRKIYGYTWEKPPVKRRKKTTKKKKKR